MKRIKEYYITIIIVAMVIVINIGAFTSYVSNVNSSLAEQTNAHVNDIMNEAVECINLKLEEQEDTLNMLALFVSSLKDHAAGEDIIREALEDQRLRAGYSVLEVVSTDGTGMYTGESYLDKEYYESALKGNTVMQEETEGSSVTAVVFAAPVKDGAEESVTAVIVAKMDMDTLSEAIELSGFNRNGKVFVVEKDGTLVSKSNELKGAQSISDIFPEKQYEDRLISGMRSRNSGIINYVSGNTTRYIGYSRLDYNRWYVVSVISSSAVEAGAGDVETDVIILGVELGIILLVLLAYLVYNIVNIKNKEKINLERYFIAARYADTVVTDYSVKKDTMYSNHKWKELFGYALPRTNVRERIKECMAPEAVELWEAKTAELEGKHMEEEFSIGLLDKDKNVIPCRVRLIPICEKKGKILIKIIGFIEREEQ